jgi:hypothetical protein
MGPSVCLWSRKEYRERSSWSQEEWGGSRRRRELRQPFNGEYAVLDTGAKLS